MTEPFINAYIKDNVWHGPPLSVPGHITSDYLASEPFRNGARHGGVDFRDGGNGWGVAVAPGRVIAAGYYPANSHCGWKVEIEHDNGTKSKYCHFAAHTVVVDTGDRVQAGDFLGRIGATGFVTGPHLHFQLEDPDRNSDPTMTTDDPKEYLIGVPDEEEEPTMTLPHISVRQLGTGAEGLTATFNPNTVQSMKIVTATCEWKADRDVIVSVPTQTSAARVGPNGASVRVTGSDNQIVIQEPDSGQRAVIALTPAHPLALSGPIEILSETPQEAPVPPAPPEPTPVPTPTPPPTPAPSPGWSEELERRVAIYSDLLDQGFTDEQIEFITAQQWVLGI